MHNDIYFRHYSNGVEDKRHLVNGVVDWERAVPVTTSKAALVTMQPTRVVRNLFDISKLANETVVSVSGSTITIKGTSVQTNKHLIDICPSLEVGKTYTLHMGASSTTTNKHIWLQSGAAGGQWANNTSRTITQEDLTTGYVKFYAGASGQTIVDMMIVEGSTAPDGYYPYFSPSTVLSSLRANGADPVKHKAPKLWGKFVPAEYISFDGSSYLDLAPLTTESDIEITFRRSSYTQTNFLFGTNPDSPTSQMVGAWYGSSGFAMQNGAERKSATIDTNWHTVKFTSTKMYLDGVEQGNAGTRTYFQALVIGSARQPNSSGAVDSRGFRGDISRVKVGNKIFTACKDVTANTFGLLDLATDTFYGNAGTGTITGGSLIQPISYAQSDGTQHITLPFVPNGDSRVSCDVQITSDALNTELSPFGVMGTYSAAGFYIDKWQGGYAAAGYGNQGAKPASGVISYDRNRHTYELDKNLLKVDGVVKYTFTYQQDIGNTRQLTLMGATQGSNLLNCCPAKWFGFEVDDNGEEAYRLIPVRVGTTVELLDLVNWQFATRTGTFTAGADIPYDTIVPQIIKVNTGDLLYGQYGANLFDYTSMVNGFLPQTGAYPTTNPSYPNAKYTLIPLLAGESVSLHKDGGEGSINSRMRCIYDGEVVDTISTASNAYFTSTAPYNASTFPDGTITAKKDITLGILGLSGLVEFEKVIIVKGTTVPTEYEPYHFGIHTDGSHKLFIGSQGVVDLGTLNWNSNSYGFAASVSNMDTSSQQVGYVDGLHYAQSGTNEGDYRTTSGYIGIATSKYATAAEFKSAMSGKYLFYQRTDDTEFVPPEVRDIPMLLSADSFVDTQVDSNNKSEAWAVKVLDGTEDWVKEGVAWRFYIFGGYDAEVRFVKVYCSHAQYKEKTLATLTDGEVSAYVYTAGSGKLTFVLGKTADSLADFKAWLAAEYAKGTPVIVVYPLATPAVSTHAIDKVELTEKQTYTVVGAAELAVTEQATYLGI